MVELGKGYNMLSSETYFHGLNKQTNSTLFRSLVHTYFKPIIYKIKAHQQLQMLFIHHYTSSGKLIELNTANVDKSTILDQIFIIKQSTWVIFGGPRFIPLNIINSRY